uniref:Uncharacterized protein n=1 Tax=viral metagenome TaxID=1070528 RepID=A0A6H1Z8V2_9ZZZZ
MYNTWNRVVHISPLQAFLPVEVYIERTLSIKLVDRAFQFDFIEWKLDNHDGLLTRPEYVAAGLVFLVKLGYIDGAMPWKAFIINRLQGGVGVWGPEAPAVSEAEGTITYHGRNRNAPGGKASRGGKKAKAAPKKAKKVYGATSDLTKHELMIGSAKGRRIQAKTTSDAVRLIAERNGFKGGSLIIQETGDKIEGADIPEGMSDGQYLADLADKFQFIYKIENSTLHWHSPVWQGAEAELVRVLTYGAGDSILSLSLDGDFRLPMPSKVTAKARDPMRHMTVAVDGTHGEFSRRADIAAMIVELPNDGARSQTLLRDEVGPTIGSVGAISRKIQQRFLQRHWNAFQINVTVVGDPVLLATKLVEIRGTGCPLVDRKWYIDEAEHIIGANDYRTTLKLKYPPKKPAYNKTCQWMAVATDPKRGATTRRPNVAALVVVGRCQGRKQRAAPATIRQLQETAARL